MNEKPYTKQELSEYNRLEAQFIVRGLQLLNGAGMVALLAFLSQVWKEDIALRPIILISIALMGVGLACAQLSATIRLRMTYRWMQGIKSEGWWNRTFLKGEPYILLRQISFIMFLASGLWLLIRLFSFV